MKCYCLECIIDLKLILEGVNSWDAFPFRKAENG